MLLDHGADPFETDAVGNDAFMFACVFGRTENVKFWLKRFPNWDLERKNKVVGGNALGQAVHMGPRRVEIVKILLDNGAKLDYRTDTGGSILSNICSCVDGSPELIQFVFDRMSHTLRKQEVNFQNQAQTFKWKAIHRIARFLVRNKLTHSGLAEGLARIGGSTALHSAVRSGDVDVVNLLLQYGADPSLKNALGMSSVDFCINSEMRAGLLRATEQRVKKIKTICLHRRDSTASDLKFPMYLVPLDQLQQIYGGNEPRERRIEAHQVLKKRGELVRWTDLPNDANIIFMSHEWVGWSHPDPHGIQLKTFLGYVFSFFLRFCFVLIVSLQLTTTNKQTTESWNALLAVKSHKLK